MHRQVKYVLALLVILALVAVFARAGDAFLDFVGEKIHINIEYENHSGFVSCFLLRFIELDKPVFTLKDFDLTFGCEKAFIKPGFERLLKEKTIVLNCAFENASLLSPEEKIKGKDNDFLALFQGNLSLLFDRLANQVFENINGRLLIYGETVKFPFFEAQSEYVKLYASGAITESGTLDISAKLFFSPEIVKNFPEALSEMLTEESRGWASYYLHLESEEDKASLKLESDRFRLNFERLDVK